MDTEGWMDDGWRPGADTDLLTQSHRSLPSTSSPRLVSTHTRAHALPQFNLISPGRVLAEVPHRQINTDSDPQSAGAPRLAS